jgi:hypothetical protein
MNLVLLQPHQIVYISKAQIILDIHFCKHVNQNVIRQAFILECKFSPLTVHDKLRKIVNTAICLEKVEDCLFE